MNREKLTEYDQVVTDGACPSLSERLSDIVWSLGIRARDNATRFGLLGLGEIILRRLARPSADLAKGDVSALLPAGFRIIAPASYTGLRYMRAGLYERAATRLFVTIVKPGMTVVDLGANIGYYTVLSSRLMGTEGRVYSFEPDLRAYAYLRRNIEANKSVNVDAFRLAVAESGRTSWFNPDPHLAEGYLTRGSGKNRTMVEVISLDEFFGKHQWPRVDLVKMDVEGSEGSVLEGMRQLASKNKQMRLVMELSLNALRRTNTSTNAIALTLQALGYTRGYIIERNMKPFQVEDGLPVSSATYNLLFAH